MAKNLSAPTAEALSHEGTPASSPPARRTFQVRGDRRPTPAAGRKTKADRHAAVVLIYKPGRYDVFGDAVLPHLVQQPLQSGVGGVSLLRNGDWDMSGLRDDAEGAGGFVLLPLDYVFPGADGTAEFAWSSPAEYHAWVAEAVASGRIPAATRDDVERVVERKAADLALIDSNQRDPHARNIGRAEVARQLDVAQAALAAFGVPA